MPVQKGKLLGDPSTSQTASTRGLVWSKEHLMELHGPIIESLNMKSSSYKGISPKFFNSPER